MSFSVEGSPVVISIGRRVDGGLDGGADAGREDPAVGTADGIPVGLAEAGGHVGAMHVTVSYVAHVTGLATPTAAFATERMRVAVPSTAARLAADTSTQSMPEEQAPAHASIQLAV